MPAFSRFLQFEYVAPRDHLAAMAQASGDPEQFRAALDELFDRASLRIEAGNIGYRMSARAKDRKRTRVALKGP